MHTEGEEEEATENARELFVNAATAFVKSYAVEDGRQRLLTILRNNDCRDELARCVNEMDVIRAFLCASAAYDVELLQVFYDVGMNVDTKNQEGKSALIHSSSRGKKESVLWLLDHGANADIQDHDGWTSLICASQLSSPDIVELLLKKDADPDIADDSGYTALMHASYCGNNKVVQLLLDHNANVDLKDIDGTTALDVAANEDIKEMLRNHVNASYVLK